MSWLAITLSDECHQALRETVARQHKSIRAIIEASLHFYSIKSTKNGADYVSLARKSSRMNVVSLKDLCDGVLLSLSYGKGKSLGPQSDETEAKYSAFRKGKSEAVERLKSIRKMMAEKAALNRAVGLNRVPFIVSRIVREIDSFHQ